MSAATPRRPEIVIVGGGAGGAELACSLGRRAGGKGAEITLVDCVAGHVWKPRLHEVAAGLLGAGANSASYLSLAKANNFRFRYGSLTGLDAAAKTVTIGQVKDEEGEDLLSARTVPYDKLVLAFGSQVNDFGIEGVTSNCFVLDGASQALAFQRRLLELAVRVSDGTLPRLRVGIIGAGATGVELAAELCQAVSAMNRFGALLPVDLLDVTVVDMASRVLANSDPATSGFAAAALERLGVKVRLNAAVERVTAEGIQLKGGDVIPCELKVWASGVIGHPLAAKLAGLQTDRGRRIVCNGDLSCKDAPDIFALGDCALVIDRKTGRPLPPTAQVAHQQARYLQRILQKPAAKAARGAFQYRPMGSLISFGSGPAVGEFPLPKAAFLSFSGVVPKLLYGALHLTHQASLLGPGRALAFSLADALRRTTGPPVKLH